MDVSPLIMIGALVMVGSRSGASSGGHEISPVSPATARNDMSSSGRSEHPIGRRTAASFLHGRPKGGSRNEHRLSSPRASVTRRNVRRSGRSRSRAFASIGAGEVHADAIGDNRSRPGRGRLPLRPRSSRVGSAGVVTRRAPIWLGVLGNSRCSAGGRRQTSGISSRRFGRRSRRQGGSIARDRRVASSVRSSPCWTCRGGEAGRVLKS